MSDAAALKSLQNFIDKAIRLVAAWRHRAEHMAAAYEALAAKYASLQGEIENIRVQHATLAEHSEGALSLAGQHAGTVTDSEAGLPAFDKRIADLGVPLDKGEA